jgi:hypothetical protein
LNHMNSCLASELNKLSKAELIRYAGFLEKSFWNIQGNWMLHVTNAYGTDTAAEFDRKVFDRNGRMQAFKIKEALGLKENMEDFAKALTLSTVFSNVEYHFPEIRDNRMRVLVTECTMQMNRRKLNLPELPCKQAGIAACEGFATAFDPRIRTTCLMCPPDVHEDHQWCHWLFEIPE